MKARVIAALAAVLIATSAQAQTSSKPRRGAEPELPVWSSLERFRSDAEFLAYVRQAHASVGRNYREAFAYSDTVAPIMAPPPPPPPAPMVGGAPTDGAVSAQEIVTTASRTSGDGESSITNVQTRGVDEGGIVKQIGRFLLVLQDGRVFVADTRAHGGAGLALASRTNVYRSPGQDTWYDEMLVSGNRVLVTGYSYAENASEVTVFTLSETGQLSREATYYISSNDYYDVENYATRLVDGNLVIYTPLDVANIDPSRTPSWPIIRRWIRDRGDGERAVTTRGRPLFDAMDIYKPITATRAPLIHSVSVCPLGGDLTGDELECRTTAFVAGSEREFYVSTGDIYLWITPGWEDYASECASPSAIFQVPLNGAAPRAVFARGDPINQLALDASPTEFRALVNTNGGYDCNHNGRADLAYLRVPFSNFATTPRAAPRSAYVDTPEVSDGQYEVRFTDTHLVYGGRDSYGSSPPQGGDARTGRVVAVPLDRPQNAATIEAPHNIIRVERAGRNAVLTGYRTDAGLSVSLLDLGRRTPRIAQTRLLDNRYESEGRSHAFNALVREEGDGVMGLPTVSRVKESGRWYFRSQASDVSFLTVNARNELGDAGQLRADPAAQNGAYQCEVSCVDWYGNTRALFIGDRVFALSATELIEGSLQEGRVVERQRLNLSRPVERGAAGR